MRLFSKKSILIVLLSFTAGVLFTGSCRIFDRFLKGDLVARVDGKPLYRKELDEIIPQNTMIEDSIRMTHQFIQTWATKNLLFSLAESALSKEVKRDVQKEMEDYYTSLLVFRYEKNYVDKNLDTLILEKECEDYYHRFEDMFVAKEYVVKVRYIKISRNSPNYQIIKTLYKSRKPEDMEQLEALCYISADRYSDFDENWIPVSLIAGELDINLDNFVSQLKKKIDFIEYESDKYSQLLCIDSKVEPGKVTPFEYNLNSIREIILSKRKQELINALEADIYNEALTTNKLIIYSKK